MYRFLSMLPWRYAESTSHVKIHKSLRVARASRIWRDDMWETGVKVSLKDMFVFFLSPHMTHIEQNFFLPDLIFFTRCTHIPSKTCASTGTSDLSTSDQVFISSSLASF